MSLIPILFRDNFLDDFLRPSITKRSFLDDEYPSDFLVAIENIPPRRGFKRRCPCMPESQDKKSVQKKAKEHFEVSVDVQNFKPEEISVKMVDNYITVVGKHEEKQDEQGYVFRHFVRKYRLPEGHDVDKMISLLSSDGVLTVKAPRLVLPEAPANERTIPVVRTEEPVKIKQVHTNGEQEDQNQTCDSK